jgi:hypothetical protein
MPIPSSSATGIPQVTSAQLKAGDPSGINGIIRLLVQQIQTLQGNAGNSKISGNLTVDSVVLTGQGVGKLPAQNQAITLQVADSLYSPTALKQSLTSFLFQGQPSPGGLPGIGGSQALVTEDTHAHRLANFMAASLPVGSFYFETDRSVFYLNEAVGSKQQWVYVLGTQTGTAVTPSDTRPVDLGQYDQGYMFDATDLNVIFVWQWNTMASTGAWVPSPIVSPILFGTHSVRIGATRPAADYALGTLFYETDRNTLYVVESPASTNVWQVIPLGAMQGTTITTDQRPTDLGPTYDVGFLFHSTDRGIIYYWTGTAWAIYYQIAPALIGTHALRVGSTRLPAAYAIGQQFLETDRNNICYAVVNNSGNVWEYQSGIAVGLSSGLYTGLGTADTGLQYFATDTSQINVWTGSAWVAVGGAVTGGSGTFGSTVTLNTSPAATASVSLGPAGNYLISFSATLNVIGSGDAGVTLTAGLSAGGSAILSGAAGTSATVSNFAYVGSSGSVTITVNVSKSGGTGSSTCTAAIITYAYLGS